MRKITVVHLVEGLHIGGLERIIASIVTNLDRDAYDVSVWCLVSGGEIADEISRRGIPVKVLGMRSWRSPPFFIRLCRALKKNKTHILHVHGCTALSLGRIAAICARVPVVIAHMHSMYVWYSLKQKIIERLVSLFTDKVICCSKAVADFVVTQLAIPPGKISVVYNGVDLTSFSGCRKDDPNGEVIIGCVASLFPHKGHRYLLEAARIVCHSTLRTVKFVIVGGGILQHELQEYAERLGIASAVVFTGTSTDVSSALSSFYCAVLPSVEREGLGLSLIEAMAVGIPVIGTRVGGIPEVIADGDNGLLVVPRDAPQLAAAILALLNDPERATRMGVRGSEIVRERFSLTGMVKRIDALYRSLAT